MVTEIFLNCTHGMEFICAHCYKEWLGPDNKCAVASNGAHQFKLKLVNIDNDKVFCIAYPALKMACTYQ
jgi:hypothetical protein